MATITAVIVDPDGSARKAEIENSLAAFQAVVGGYIEGVYSDEVTIYVNEEGLIRSLAFNPTASQFAQHLTGYGYRLAGTALIVGPADEEGNDTHVRESVVSYYNLEN